MKRPVLETVTGSRWYPALLGAIVFVLHLPAFAYAVFDNDEAYIGVVAKVINHGGTLYVDAVDRKPPGVFYLYDWTFDLLHTNALWGPRMLAVICQTVTAILVWQIAKRRFGDRAGAIAGLFSALASTTLLPADAQSANFEVFMMPFICGAFLLADRERPAAAGLTLGVATMMKQTAAITLIPLVWMAWKAKRWKGIALLAGSFAIPIVVCLVVFPTGDFWFWVFGGANSGYLEIGGGILLVLGRMFWMTPVLAILNIGILMVLPRAWRHRRTDRDLWLWVLSAAIAIISGTRFFGHYYWQILPPLCVLAGRGATTVSARTLRRGFQFLGAAAVVVVLVAFAMPIVTPNNHFQKLADYAKAHTRPDERIFVWGHLPGVYLNSGRLPASRVITTGFLTGHTSARPSSEVGMQYAIPGLWDKVMADLKAHPPTLIFDAVGAEDTASADYPIAKFPPMKDYLEANYHLVDVIDRTLVYRRNGPAYDATASAATAGRGRPAGRPRIGGASP